MSQQVIFENQIEAHLERHLERYLKMYFDKHYLSVENLKKGKGRCFFCGKPLKAHTKTMDKRLIVSLLKIVRFIDEKKRKKLFTPSEVFGDNHLEIADFEKLSFWGLIKRTKKGSWWELTYKGRQFAKGNIQIPQRVGMMLWLV